MSFRTLLTNQPSGWFCFAQNSGFGENVSPKLRADTVDDELIETLNKCIWAIVEISKRNKLIEPSRAITRQKWRNHGQYHNEETCRG